MTGFGGKWAGFKKAPPFLLRAGKNFHDFGMFGTVFAQVKNILLSH